jgi:hypothetical protein
VIDAGHVRVVVARTRRGREVVEAVELCGGELDTVCGGVLLDAGDPAGAGDRGDVVAAGQQPGQRGLRGGGADLGADGRHLVDDREVAPEVLTGEAGIGLAPVVVGEVVDRADLAGQQPVAERRIGDEPVQNGRLDIVAVNRLGRAVFSEMYVQPQRPANFGRFVFLDPRAQAFYRDWADAAQQTVAILRTEAGRAPRDRALTAPASRSSAIPSSATLTSATKPWG